MTDIERLLKGENRYRIWAKKVIADQVKPKPVINGSFLEKKERFGNLGNESYSWRDAARVGVFTAGILLVFFALIGLFNLLALFLK